MAPDNASRMIKSPKDLLKPVGVKGIGQRGAETTYIEGGRQKWAQQDAFSQFPNSKHGKSRYATGAAALFASQQELSTQGGQPDQSHVLELDERPAGHAQSIGSVKSYDQHLRERIAARRGTHQARLDRGRHQTI